MKYARAFAFLSAMLALVFVLHVPDATAETPSTGSQASDNFSLITPEQLLQALKLPEKQRPLILQVGVHSLYLHSHIPGAEYVGPAGHGIESLRKRTVHLPRNTFIVIYCGCCPWSYCPNFRPAAEELRKMGFTNFKVLHLPTTFQVDWANKGYPVTKQ